MNNEKIFFFRKGTALRDAAREKRTEVLPPNASIWLLPVLTQQKVVVPRGKLLVPIDFDGTPLEARLRGSQDLIKAYPEFRLLGVEEGDGGKRMAAALYN